MKWSIAQDFNKWNIVGMGTRKYEAFNNRLTN